jgi:hypothetical protein
MKLDYVMVPTVSSSLGSCQATPIKKKKEDEMSMSITNSSFRVDTPAQPESLELQQKKHFLARLDEIKSEHKMSLKKKFFIIEDAPKTFKEFSERLSKGQFTFSHKGYEDTDPCYFWTEYFSWRTQPADRAGYDLAKEKLNKSILEASDAIWASTDGETALKAVQKFEKWTLH